MIITTILLSITALTLLLLLIWSLFELFWKRPTVGEWRRHRTEKVFLGFVRVYFRGIDKRIWTLRSIYWEVLKEEDNDA